MGIGWRPCSSVEMEYNLFVCFFRHVGTWLLIKKNLTVKDCTYQLGFVSIMIPKRKKMKEPRLSAEALHLHVQELSTVLIQPWFSANRFDMYYVLTLINL